MTRRRDPRVAIAVTLLTASVGSVAGWVSTMPDPPPILRPVARALAPIIRVVTPEEPQAWTQSTTASSTPSRSVRPSGSTTTLTVTRGRSRTPNSGSSSKRTVHTLTSTISPTPTPAPTMTTTTQPPGSSLPPPAPTTTGQTTTIPSIPDEVTITIPSIPEVVP